MNDDFKRPLGDVKKQPVAPIVHTDALPPPVENRPMVVKEKKKTSKAFSFVSILLLLSLLGAGVMTYLWYEAQNKLEEAQVKASALETDITMLKSNNAASKVPVESTTEMPSFNTFLTAYDAIIKAEKDVTIDRIAAKNEIETALKQYYKLAQLPQGWTILSIYQVVKPQTPPSGDLKALVYWPATDTKPAGFIPMTKAADGAWKYEELR